MDIETKNKIIAYLGEGVTYDEYGTQIWANYHDGEIKHVLDVRGWGTIQNMFKSQDDAAKFQDSLGAFIVEAINEKLERESSPQPSKTDNV